MFRHRTGLLLAATAMSAQPYRQPPPEIVAALHAPATPIPSVNPSRTHLLLAEPMRYPPIAELARPFLRLAGLRVDPHNNAQRLAPAYLRLTLIRIEDGRSSPVSLPPGARLGAPLWSPDGTQFAVTNTTATTVELWVGSAAGGALRKLASGVNTVSSPAVQWMPDSRTLLVQMVPSGRGNPPVAPAVPPGPVIQESAGKSGPVRTYQDLLGNPHDEALLDYYATAQVTLLDAAAGKASPVGAPGILLDIEPSPDGSHLLVTRVQRPYSYLHPLQSFPQIIEVWDRTGKTVYTVATHGLADRIPIEGVRTGPRGVRWQPSVSNTLVWVEALDGGNPKETAPHRDRVVSIQAPFQGEPQEWTRTQHRFAGLEFSGNAGVALLRDYDRDRRWLRTFLLNPQKRGEPARLLFSHSIRDRYGDPGTPVMRTAPNGARVLLQSAGTILLTGEGASPQGDRPFLDRYSLTTQRSERLFRSDAGAYETVVAVLDERGERLLTRRESPTDPPNFFLRSGDTVTALTRFADPAPALRGIGKQLVTYSRPDGVPLSMTLYLPPGYKAGTRLPAVMWAYPREFNDADTAGQVSGSPQRFTTLAGASHLFLLLRGYAVLDNAALPVIGDPETANNTYLDQIVAGAKAAIDKAASLGVIDPRRVGVAGHSYGGFMTANLLAHSDLFRAGVARSGAYNRTLTPFGFQSERRTLWEAPDVYLRMSPFLHAHKINEPILLIHGEADNNPGTFPVQSERLYQAVRGNGGQVRLVMLPYESHSYVARESVEHTLAEMVDWFDRHLAE